MTDKSKFPERFKVASYLLERLAFIFTEPGEHDTWTIKLSSSVLDCGLNPNRPLWTSGRISTERYGFEDC